MSKQLERKVNILTGYAVVSVLFFGYILFSSFTNNERHEKMDELTVKRINVIGEDGHLRMVISNETRQHSGIINGKEIPQRERPAGIIFFNDEGDECGGLIFHVKDTGEKVYSGMSFTMDNYHHDQVVQLVNDEKYADGKGVVKRGLVINEVPVGSDLSKILDIQKIKDSVLRERKLKKWSEEEGSRQRLFVGRNRENETGLFLYDTTGKPRMEIFVDKSGEPRIKIIDENGHSKDVLLQ